MRQYQNAVSDLVGIMVVHTLRVDFLTDRGTESTYITMNDDDLAWLGREIDWARQKGEALRGLSSKLDLKFHERES